MKVRINLFSILLVGGIILFFYCLFSFITGELLEAIRHPIAFIHGLYVSSNKEHTIFDFFGVLLDQLMPDEK
jgi:hypothetical protein